MQHCSHFLIEKSGEIRVQAYLTVSWFVIYTVGESSLNCAIVSGLQPDGRLGKIPHVPNLGPVTQRLIWVSHVWIESLLPRPTPAFSFHVSFGGKALLDPTDLHFSV